MTDIQLKYPEKEYFFPPPGGHSACPGCALPVVFKCLLKVLGQKTVVVNPPGCTALLSGLLLNPVKKEESVLGLSVPFGTSAACAAGLKSALVARGDTETQVVAFTGDGATMDIGFQSLSACAERNEDIIYVCCDNEGYQNTGNQRSSATPPGAATSTTPFPMTKTERKKDIMLAMAAHAIPYAASATVAYPEDMIRKINEAKNTAGLRFLYLLTPCTTGWQYPAHLTIKISRLAVHTRIFPLMEIRHGINITVRKETEAVPVSEYVKLQGRFKHFTGQDIEAWQTSVDHKWAYLKWLEAYRKPG